MVVVVVVVVFAEGSMIIGSKVSAELVVTIFIVDVKMGSSVVVAVEVSVSIVLFVAANKFRYSTHVWSVKGGSAVVESEDEGSGVLVVDVPMLGVVVVVVEEVLIVDLVVLLAVVVS